MPTRQGDRTKKIALPLRCGRAISSCRPRRSSSTRCCKFAISISRMPCGLRRTRSAAGRTTGTPPRTRAAGVPGTGRGVGQLTARAAREKSPPGNTRQGRAWGRETGQRMRLPARCGERPWLPRTRRSRVAGHRSRSTRAPRSSFTDVLALARNEAELCAMAVEAKAGEPFGPTVAEKRVYASGGQLARLEHLQSRLGVQFDPTVREKRHFPFGDRGEQAEVQQIRAVCAAELCVGAAQSSEPCLTKARVRSWRTTLPVLSKAGAWREPLGNLDAQRQTGQPL